MKSTYSRVPALAGTLAVATASVAATPARAQDAPQETITAAITDASLRYGQPVIVRGNAPAGRTVVLQYRARSAARWVPAASATANRQGRYRLALPLSRTGEVRVTVPAARAAGTFASGEAPATRERLVRVAAHLRTRSARLNVAVGRRARVRGTLRRPRGGRVVALQARIGSRWRTLDRDRTDGRGRFALSTVARRSASLRVSFAGDGLNTPVRRSVGRMRAFRQAAASWYGPGFYGNTTACGQTFHAGIMGVAHKTLPCGTKLTFRAGSRIVRARVVDRGPFHAGREFDLSPAVKAALGFGSTGSVWVAV